MNRSWRQRIVFWFCILVLLTAIFASGSGNAIHGFYFSTFLLPVAIGLDHFYNSFLVPKYLLKKKYWSFGLYTLYAVIVSLYLEIMILLGAFIVLANYQYENLNPSFTNVFMLLVVLYAIMFFNAFVAMVRMHFEKENTPPAIQAKMDPPALIVKSGRKQLPVNPHDILYIESLDDSLKIWLEQGDSILTRERISHLEGRLPSGFTRIHRSFIVQKSRVSSFQKESVTVGSSVLPVGRKYKQQFLADFFPK